MLEFEVSNVAELVAALKCAAQPTYEDAKRNPVRIVFGTCVYTFKEGLIERRARKITAQARYQLRRRNK